MKSIAQFVIALSFIFCSSVSLTAQKIDTQPLDAYWKMIEPLKHGDSLSISVWKDFLAIEPNQVYTDNQGFDSSYLERLRQNIQFVYMPKYDSLLQARVAAMKKDQDAYWFTYKVYQYKVYETAIKEYEKKISDPSYLDSIYKNVWQWLPERLHQKVPWITIHFLGIENDAIAGDSIIIFTAYSAFINDKLKMGILGGHEMHHVLRHGIEFKNVTEPDKGLMYVLNNILNEGSADMVDKNYGLTHEKKIPFELRYDGLLLDQVDSIIKQLDTSIVVLSQSNGKIFRTEKDYRNLIRWTSGHCPGYYMANIIVRNGFKKQLIENIQNPFAFIYLYNAAAKIDKIKPPLFSSAAVKYIKELEKKYWISNQ